MKLTFDGHPTLREAEEYYTRDDILDASRVRGVILSFKIP